MAFSALSPFTLHAAIVFKVWIVSPYSLLAVKTIEYYELTVANSGERKELICSSPNDLGGRQYVGMTHVLQPTLITLVEVCSAFSVQRGVYIDDGNNTIYYATLKWSIIFATGTPMALRCLYKDGE